MKKNKEIVSLNSMDYEFNDSWGLDERLEKLTMSDLKRVKAGELCTDFCTDFSFVLCPKELCDPLCEYLDCPFGPGGCIDCNSFGCACEEMDACYMFT